MKDLTNKYSALFRLGAVYAKKYAFTLAEMMVVMLILSIVMAAFAPVMTKRNNVDLSSPWTYLPENNSDIYYGMGNRQTAYIGQNKVVDTDPMGRLFIVTSTGEQNHIVFKLTDNTVLGQLYLNNLESIILGNGVHTGSSNTVVGIGAFLKNTVGMNNIAVGTNTLTANTTGQSNTAVGDSALHSNTTGSHNTAMGTGLMANTTGSNNTALGDDTLTRNTSGENNIAIGVNALQANSSGSGNVAVGNQSILKSLGDNNTALGHLAMQNSIGSKNVAVGANSSVTTNSVAVGEGADASESATAVGQNSKSTGKDSIAIGHSVNATSSNSTAIGYSANATSSNSTAIGYSANAEAFAAIAIGDANGTSYSAIALGNNANATGSYSAAVGYQATASGVASIAIGDNTNASGNFSIALGDNAQATGWAGVALGQNAVAKGQNVTAIGYGACSNVTGSNKTCIGAYSGPPAGGNNATSSVEHIFIGSKSKLTNGDAVLEVINSSSKAGYYSESAVVINGNLVVNGLMFSSNRGGGGPWEHTDQGDDNGKSGHIIHWNNAEGYYASGNEEQRKISDRRLKNIKNENQSGLDKIRELKIFNFTFKKDPKKTPHVGVIAQDLQKVFPDAVTKGEDGYLRIRMEDMFYSLINAVKELDRKVTLLLKQESEKDRKIKELEDRLNKLEKKLN